MFCTFLKFLATFQGYHFKKGKKLTRLTRLGMYLVYYENSCSQATFKYYSDGRNPLNFEVE